MNDEAVTDEPNQPIKVDENILSSEDLSKEEQMSLNEDSEIVEQSTEKKLKTLDVQQKLTLIDDDARSRDDIESTMVEVDSSENLSADVEDADYQDDDDIGDEDAGYEEEEVQNDGMANENAEELFKKLSAAHRKANRTIDDNNLPPTVSLLQGPKGEKIYLIGTAHFSKESCEDVKRVISQAQPDVVMIELCRGRTDLLTNDEETLSKLAGDVSFDKIMTQIKHKGLIPGLMTFLLLHMSAHITKQLGMAPGGEFRTAYQESRLIPGCKLLFGDRAVEVTLQRAFATFSIIQKMKFALCVLKDLGPIKPEDIEKLKQKDMLEQALEEMMGEFPQMTKVFLDERDIYLAYSLQLAAANEVRTESGVEPTVVVGVVGLGHAGGIKNHFEREITEDEIRKLIEVPKQSRTRKFIKKCLKLSFFLCMGYGIYRFTSWTGLFSYFGNFSIFGIANASVSELESKSGL